MREILEIQSLCYVILLASHGAVDDEVERTVDDQGEVLDGGESEHPAGVNWHQSQTHTKVCSLRHT